MDITTRIEIVKIFYANGSSPAATLRAYKTLHNLSVDPFNATTISRLIRRFEDTGSVHDRPKSGRPSLVEDRRETVQRCLTRLQSEDDLQVACSTHVSKETGIPQSSVYCIEFYVMILNCIHTSSKSARR